MNNQNLRNIKVLWFAVAAVPALYMLLSETELIPTDFLSANESGVYAIELLSVVLSLCGIWLALRLMSFSWVKRKVGSQTGCCPLSFWYKLRLAIIGTPLWILPVLYYATSATSTPAYCLIITALAYLFCYPQETGTDK